MRYEVAVGPDPAEALAESLVQTQAVVVWFEGRPVFTGRPFVSF